MAWFLESFAAVSAMSASRRSVMGASPSLYRNSTIRWFSLAWATASVVTEIRSSAALALSQAYFAWTATFSLKSSSACRAWND